MSRLTQSAVDVSNPALRNQAAIRELQGRLDEVQSPNAAPFTTLPTSPVSGQTIFFQTAAMATLNVIWQLRYRGAISKWEFVGGQPLYGDNASNGSGAVGVWIDISTSFAIPLPGVYRIEWGGQVSAAPTAAYVWHIGIVVPGGTNPVASTDEAIFAGPSAGGASAGGNIARESRKTLIAGTLKLQGRVEGFATTFTNTYLRATPVTL